VPEVIKSFEEAVLNVVNIFLPVVVISVYCTTYLAYRKASCRLEYSFNTTANLFIHLFIMNATILAKLHFNA